MTEVTASVLATFLARRMSRFEPGPDLAIPLSRWRTLSCC
jgi:hypothetical protein